MISSICRLARRLMTEDEGQDLVEYALLGAFVALATIGGLKAIESVIGVRYVAWDLDEQNLWRPPNP